MSEMKESVLGAMEAMAMASNRIDELEERAEAAEALAKANEERWEYSRKEAMHEGEARTKAEARVKLLEDNLNRANRETQEWRERADHYRAKAREMEVKASDWERSFFSAQNRADKQALRAQAAEDQERGLARELERLRQAVYALPGQGTNPDPYAILERVAEAMKSPGVHDLDVARLIVSTWQETEAGRLLQALVERLPGDLVAGRVTQALSRTGNAAALKSLVKSLAFSFPAVQDIVHPPAAVKPAGDAVQALTHVVQALQVLGFSQQSKGDFRASLAKAAELLGLPSA